MIALRMTEEPTGLEQQEADDEDEAQEKRRLGSQRGGHDRVDEPEHQSAEDGAGDAAEAPQKDDDERLQERLLAHHRFELENGSDGRGGGRGQREAYGHAQP